MLRELDANNFEDEIKQGLKLVEFYTTWCGYCKKQLSELEKMEKIWIGQVDADNNMEIANKYEINAYPTFIIFKDGEKKERISGLISKEKLMESLVKYL